MGSAQPYEPPGDNPKGNTGGSIRHSIFGLTSSSFTLLWAGSAVSQLGTVGAAATNPILAFALTGSPVFAGWVAAASALPGIICHIPAGIMADSWDRRQVMLWSQVIRAVSATLLCVGILLLWDPTVLLPAAAIIDGACAAVYRIAEIAAIQCVVPENKTRESAMATNEARHHVTLVFGRPLGGVLYAINRSVPYAFDALTSLFSIVSLFILRGEGNLNATGGKGGTESIFKIGWAVLRRDRFLLGTLAACSLANMVFQMVVLLLIVQAQAQGVKSPMIGLLLGVSGASGALGAAIAPRVLKRWEKPESITMWCLVLWAPMMLIVAWQGNLYVGFVMWGLCSLVGAQINVALAVHQGNHIEGSMHGRIAGFNKFVTTGALAIGAAAGGYVIAAFKPAGAAVTALAIFMCLAVTVLILQRERAKKDVHIALRWWLSRLRRVSAFKPVEAAVTGLVIFSCLAVTVLTLQRERAKGEVHDTVRWVRELLWVSRRRPGEPEPVTQTAVEDPCPPACEGVLCPGTQSGGVPRETVGLSG